MSAKGALCAVLIRKADNGERIGVKNRPEIPAGCLFEFAESFRTAALAGARC
jgi:hypothetical protein